MVEVRNVLDKCRQRDKESNAAFLDHFKAIVESYEHSGGSIGNDEGLLKELENTEDADYPGDVPATGTGEEVREWIKKKDKYVARLKKEARNRMLGIMFLLKVDPAQYGDLCASIYNQFTRGSDHYPTSLTTAYNMVNEHRHESVLEKKSNKKEEDEITAGGLSLLQHHELVPGTDERVHNDIECYGCKKKGHYKSKCPSKETTSGINALQVDNEGDVEYGLMFAQLGEVEQDISKSWILLDSQSTVSVFNNGAMLENIKEVQQKLNLLTNGGYHLTNMKGELKNYGTVWYSPKSLANTLSLAEVRKKFRVTMDTQVEASITVHRKSGTKMKFLEYRNGLYYYDVPIKNNKLNNQTTD